MPRSGSRSKKNRAKPRPSTTPSQPSELSDRNSFGILGAPDGGVPTAGDEEEPDEIEEKELEQAHDDDAAGGVGDGASCGIADDTDWSTAAVTSGDPDNSTGPAADLLGADNLHDHLPSNDPCAWRLPHTFGNACERVPLQPRVCLDTSWLKHKTPNFVSHQCRIH